MLLDTWGLGIAVEKLARVRKPRRESVAPRLPSMGRYVCILICSYFSRLLNARIVLSELGFWLFRCVRYQCSLRCTLEARPRCLSKLRKPALGSGLGCHEASLSAKPCFGFRLLQQGSSSASLTACNVE